jgi:hypothetical protein
MRPGEQPHVLVDTGTYGIQQLPVSVCHDLSAIHGDKAELPRGRGRAAAIRGWARGRDRGRGQGGSRGCGQADQALPRTAAALPTVGGRV